MSSVLEGVESVERVCFSSWFQLGLFFDFSLSLPQLLSGFSFVPDLFLLILCFINFSYVHTNLERVERLCSVSFHPCFAGFIPCIFLSLSTGSFLVWSKL